MFFTDLKQAKLYAKLETMRTHYRHFVTPSRKYICPPNEYFGTDSIPGFTVILR